jgi:hypothetical protein
MARRQKGITNLQPALRSVERRSGKDRRVADRRVNPDPTLLLSDEEHRTIDAAFAAISEVFRQHGLTPPSAADWRNTRLRNGLIDYILTIAA